MGKLAFVFAGQGAQAVGMGKELAENFPIADKTFDEASEALGFDIKDMIWNGDSETLMITENTQPTIVTMSVAALRVLQEKGIKPDVVAGLSLGEYTAHIASGSMEFADGVRLVKKRGKYMQEEVPVGKGAMAAIIALSAEDVIACCEEASKVGICSPANFNCPGQIVVSGEVAAVDKCCELAKEKGAKRALKLPVSAPFHCAMLIGAGEKLAKELENVEVKDMQIPVITNVTADYVSSKEDIKPLLIKQVSSSVKWEETIRRMIADGVDTFVEVGPGKALSGFIKKVSRDVKVFNVEDMASLDRKSTRLNSSHIIPSSDYADETCEEVKKLGVECIVVKGDVRNTEDVQKLVSETMDKFGHIDIFVNNAGITRDGLMIRMSEDDWDLVMDINLKGAFNCIKAVARPMMKQRSGAIINMASIVGVMGNPGQANYVASKAGLIGLTKTTAKEFASRGIRCNAVAPGFIRSAMTDVLSDDVKKKYLDSIPLGEFGETENIADVVAFLASDMSKYVTGQVINVDGGLVM